MTPKEALIKNDFYTVYDVRDWLDEQCFRTFMNKDKEANLHYNFVWRELTDHIVNLIKEAEKC